MSKQGCPKGAILRNGRCIKPVYNKVKKYYVAQFVAGEIKLETYGLKNIDDAKKKAIKFMKQDGMRRDIIIYDGVLKWKEINRR